MFGPRQEDALEMLADVPARRPTPQTDGQILQHLIEHQLPFEVCFRMLATYAASRRASDLFCVANRNGHRLFMRCGRALYQLGQVSKGWGEHLINHVKLRCQLPINGHKYPLDGRLLIHDGRVPIDLRVSVMPSYFGEELAIRILDGRFRLVDFDDLGLLPVQRHAVERLMHQRSGLVLAGGQPGSGKTTTLYAILNALNDGSRKINTIENPVECDIDGVHQTQVDLENGLDFPDLLRALLRHTPDVIMVGEIRDKTTAEVAVHAAIAGQLVFATVHAHNASLAVDGLLQLGVNRHLLATALKGVIAQDMLHKPCPKCALTRSLPSLPFSLDRVIDLWGLDFAPTPVETTGCPECDQRGYQGLTGIYEVMEAVPEILDLIRDGASPEMIGGQAALQGMLSLSDSAQIAFAQGRTTLSESIAVYNDRRVPV